MQAGDVFTITADTIAGLEKAGYSVSWTRGQKKNKQFFRLQPGTQFRITPKGMEALPVEVYASKLSDKGVAGKGRPRRFPPQLVADLLGTNVPQAPPPQVKASSDDLSVASGDGVTVVDVEPAVKAEPIISDEERAAQEERVKRLIGLIPDDSTVDDW